MSTQFPNGVDPAVVIDALFRFGNPNAKQLDEQVRAIQAYLANISRITLPDSNTTLNIAQWSTGAAVFNGTLTATRTVTAPTVSGRFQQRFVINATAHDIVLNPSSGGSTMTVPTLGSLLITYDGYNFYASTGGGSSSSNATQIQSVPVTPGTPGIRQVLGSSDGVNWAPVSLTGDWVGAGFSATLSFHSGGTSPVECGQTGITPTFDGNPQPNAAGVTVYSITDNQGGSPTSRLGSAGGFQGPSTTYIAPSTAGSMIWTVTITDAGITKNPTAAIGVLDRYGVGQDAASDATSATWTGGNMVLAGGASSATLSSFIAAFSVGTTFAIPASGTPKYTYLWVLHTSSAFTFADASNSPFNMSRVASNVTFANQFSVSKGFDLYRTDFALTQAYTVHRSA